MNLKTKHSQYTRHTHGFFNFKGGSLPLAAMALRAIRPLPPRTLRMPKRLIVSLFLLLGISFLTTACFGNKAPDRVYYSIDYPLGSQPKYDKPRHQIAIVVSSMTTVNAYDRQEIVYRTNPYEFQYYWYRLWASKPRKMLRELVAQHLRYTKIASDVTFVVEDRLPDYVLDTEIIAIEELDVSKSEWYAHLAMRMTLLSFDTGMAVWSYDFDVKHPISIQEPVYVVKAMSDLLNAELTKAFLSMDQRLFEVKALEKTALTEASAELGTDVVGDDGAELPPEAEVIPTLSEQVTGPVKIEEKESDAQIKVDTPRATLKNSR